MTCDDAASAVMCLCHWVMAGRVETSAQVALCVYIWLVVAISYSETCLYIRDRHGMLLIVQWLVL
jgi:hypothetical protein